MSWSVKTLTVTALVFGGTVAMQSAPASAQVYRGVPVYQGGYLRYMPGPRIDGVPRVGRPGFAYRGGYVGPRYGWGGGYRPAYYGPRYGRGYRTGYWGPRYGYYGGYYPYGYYRRSYDGGGAVVAGLIGGLALGAIINAATQPAYYRSAYYPAYNNCFYERRRIVTRTGNVIVRRVRTCY